MNLNREQICAMARVRQLGFMPVNAIVLTSKSKTHNGMAVVSVSAIKNQTRFNFRIGINTKSPGLEPPVILGCDSLKTVIDFEHSENVQDINKCVVQTVVRTPVVNIS